MLALIVGLAMISAPSVAAAPTDTGPTGDVAAPAADAQATGAVPLGVVNPVSPTRLVDTRSALGASGAVAAGGSLTIPVAGVGGIPSSGARVVVLTVTVPAGTVAGSVTASPAGGTAATVPHVRFTTGRPVTTAVWVPVGPNGAVSLRNNAPRPVHLIVDSSAWTSTSSGPGAYTPVTPRRLVDTVARVGATGAVAANGSLTVPVTGRAGVPSTGVAGVLVSVTVLNNRLGGWINGRPAGFAVTSTSVLNWTAGVTATGPALLVPDSQGRIALDNRSPAPVALQVDVLGWVQQGSPNPGGLVPVVGSRAIDSRTGLGLGSRGAGPLTSGTIDLTLTGGAVPRSDVRAVLVQVIALAPSQAGELWLTGANVPGPAGVVVSHPAGETRSGLVLVPVDRDGRARLDVPSAGTRHVVVDVYGYIPALLGEGAALTWSAPQTIGAGLGTARALDCPTFYRFCLAVGSQAWATWDGNAWTTRPGAPPALRGGTLTCTTGAFCLALTDTGITQFDGDAWAAFPSPTTDALADLSCHDGQTCVLASVDGRTWEWTGRAWEQRGRIFPVADAAATKVVSLSCPATGFCGAITRRVCLEFCAAILGGGRSWFLEVTTWSASSLLQDSVISSVSCRPTRFCALTTSYGPGIGTYQAGATAVFTTQGLTAVSCADPSFCVATGGIVENPGARTDVVAVRENGSWTSPLTQVVGQPTLVSCRATDVCVALQADGRFLLSRR